MDTARVLDLLEAGDWKKAHEIVQKDSSAIAAWLHGIVHTLEGDLDNARYWYRKAKREFPGTERQFPGQSLAKPAPLQFDRWCDAHCFWRIANSSSNRANISGPEESGSATEYGAWGIAAW